MLTFQVLTTLLVAQSRAATAFELTDSTRASLESGNRAPALGYRGEPQVVSRLRALQPDPAGGRSILDRGLVLWRARPPALIANPRCITHNNFAKIPDDAAFRLIFVVYEACEPIHDFKGDLKGHTPVVYGFIKRSARDVRPLCQAALTSACQRDRASKCLSKPVAVRDGGYAHTQNAITRERGYCNCESTPQLEGQFNRGSTPQL